ncbi:MULTISPECIES: metallophosphoesterase family protein [Pseudomonas]|uniref:metallophosphoesterase family protein n=1 Tax=Pseudomonas TaxID=286 RepID=UPI0002DB73D9|nr:MULTISPECIES: metallophosphoesterase [Pseudomonas]MDC7831068.1 metallophosphoesterase [Pseudomonas benzopyrenica]
MKSIKWLHLSDFHFGKKPHNLYQQPFMASKIIEHAVKQSLIDRKPDFIFITGDIANSGAPDEYELFNEHVILPIAENFGSDYLDNVFIIPGNHDVQRTVSRNFGREEHLKFDGNFEPTKESHADRSMLIDRIKNFINHSHTSFSTAFEQEAGAYIHNISLNGLTVGLIGINTSWLCRDESDKGLLTPGLPLVRGVLSKAVGCDLTLVLGHHPLDWLHPIHAEPIKSLFAKYNVVYLHGHMHKVWGKPEYANGASFMTVQAGASFQAPEGSKWKNSILWGEASLDTQTISLQPFVWDFDEQNWKLESAGFPETHRAGDKWVFQLPKNFTTTPNQSNKKILPFGGWETIQLESLKKLTKPLTESQAVFFFDGANPNWEIAISTSIPKREIVTRLCTEFHRLKSNASGLPVVCTLLGAGCEGKTTALLQASYEIIKQENEKNILFRKNSQRPFKIDALLPMLNEHNDWLVVIDDADQEAKAILSFIESGCPGYVGRIDVLLACRDSDWRASEADSLSWGFSCAYKEIVLKDLSKVDAEKIVHSWEAYGEAGLGDGGLNNLDSYSRVEKLRYYARQESKRDEGAFFGALLLSRHNGQLLDHAEAMLARLGEKEVSDGKTLRNALAYIAVMHAEGFDKLTYDVLSAAMGMAIPQLKRVVLNKLGDEAAATGTSTTIFTRHRYIAQAIVAVLERNFDVDTAALFIELAVAAEQKAKLERVSNFEFWRFKMADAFFEKGKNVVAVQLSEALLKTDPNNYKLLTKVAKFYRKERSFTDALKLFESFQGKSPEQGFYHEWALCELEARNLIESVTFALFTISDEAEILRLDIPSAVMYLAAIDKTLAALHRDYADEAFSKTSDATWCLLSTFIKLRPDLEVPGYRAYLNRLEKKRAKNLSSVEAVNILSDLGKTVSQFKSKAELPDGNRVQHLNFSSLKTLVNNATR